MPRVRTTPVHPFIQALIDERGYTNLKEAARDLGIPYTTLLKYADEGADRSYLRSAKRMASALGVSLDDFAKGLLGADA